MTDKEKVLEYLRSGSIGILDLSLSYSVKEYENKDVGYGADLRNINLQDAQIGLINAILYRWRGCKMNSV